MLFWLVAIVAALAGLFFAIQEYPSVFEGLSGTEWAILASGGLLVIVYTLSLAREGALQPLRGFAYLMIWGLIGLAFVAGYGYRAEFAEVWQRVTGELAPPGSAIAIEGDKPGRAAVRIRRRSDGHFTARANVNGSQLSMLVDTGASTIVLKPADAEKAGIDIKSLAFSVPVQTANGTTFAAPIRLRSIAIGSIKVEGVEALVAQPGNLRESLLGMSFLRRLRSYEFTGEFLTLKS